MTSLRQLQANRQNARSSTGPRTDEGKRRSRRNALRHGLTAETVIELLEDSEDYKAFEAAIISDYDAHTAVERELVLRLASLLWRIRRATAIETDLLRIQAELMRDRRKIREDEQPQQNDVVRTLRIASSFRLRQPAGASADNAAAEDDEGETLNTDDLAAARGLTHCFLRLVHLDQGAFERLGRYEAALWRQIIQTMFALRSVRHY
jgi:hypothetical protein